MTFPSEILVFGKPYVLKPEGVLPSDKQFWRVLHDLETPRGVWRQRLPEVFQMYPAHHSEFGRSWQLLSKAMNPRISPDKWTACYTDARYVTNGQGYGVETDPRSNWVLGKNLTSPSPRVECLTTGGSLLSGYVEGNNLVVETLDVNNPPSIMWILARPWFWTYAVTVDGKGTPRRFPQGLQDNGEVVPIIHPLVGNPGRYTKITIPLSRVVRWTEPNPPDAFRLYK